MPDNAYVPEFINDIFVSYAFAANEFGWVTELKDDLAKRLKEDRAPALKVWLSQRPRCGVCG